jgi:protein-tyrosine phosphatase
MIDIHCHILPAVDDGPRSLSESLAMLSKAENDGITHIVATPHCNQSLHLFRPEIIPQVARLNEQAQLHNLQIVVLPGSEIALYDVKLYRHNYSKGRYCHLGDRPEYSLLEFPWQRDRFPDGVFELIPWLVEQGTRPIIAHPERTPVLRENYNIIQAFVEAGAWLQITVDSLLGNMSTVARDTALELMEDYEHIVLATDSHSLTRSSGLSNGYATVRDWLGPAREQDIRVRTESILQHLLSVQDMSPQETR